MDVSEETINRSKLSVYNNLCLAHDIAKILATILPLKDAVMYELIRDEAAKLVGLMDTHNAQRR